MNNEIHIQRRFQLLEAKLANVPELKPAFDIFDAAPEHAVEVYENYLHLIDKMVNLDETDIARISKSQQILAEQNGETGSASKVGANDLIAALGDRKNVLSDLAIQSFTPSSSFYQSSVDSLVTKMEGGHKLKIDGKVPSDHDPESLKVIWGHTLITGDEALLHFVVCHYLGLYFSQALTAQGIGLASQKDFFVNALTDVVILNQLKSDGTDSTFRLWSRPKESGGLGWITQSRWESYLK